MPFKDRDRKNENERKNAQLRRAAALAAGLPDPATVRAAGWAKNNPDRVRAAQQRYAEKNRDKRNAYQAARRKAGHLHSEKTPEQKEREKLRMREKRAAAKLAGVKIPGDTWAKENPDRHRSNVSKWRTENLEYSRVLTRDRQEVRRSTPWGAINNRIWTVMHKAVRANSSRRGMYTDALGYLWSDLRSHIEVQFTDDMSWSNWGEVWELDHIKPVSSFHYTSLEDPLFQEAWKFSNLRPLTAHLNLAKGAKTD